MHVVIDLPDGYDARAWTLRHARGEVPDLVPYGLHKLVAHGVVPEFRPAVHNPAAGWLARKVRGRLGEADVVAAALCSMRQSRRHADAVLCWDERNGIPAALLPGAPPVVSGACWLADPRQLPPALQRLARVALPRMAALFHFCEPMARVVEQIWALPTGTVRRVTMGVDERFYTPQPHADEPGVVMSVGDDSRRDHEHLVRVVDQVHRRGVPVELELATTLPVEVPAHLGVVHRRRMEGAILPMYRRSSVVAVAARPGVGGSGLTALLEAMACARPVVITGNPGVEEYVEHEVTGLLVPPGDERAFADALAALLADPAAAERMGLAARRAVERRFTTDHVAADLARILRSVGRSGRRGAGARQDTLCRSDIGSI